MKQFYLKEKTIDFELGYGIYQIFFTGGWYIKNLEELDIELTDLETNEKVNLKTKSFLVYVSKIILVVKKLFRHLNLVF